MPELPEVETVKRGLAPLLSDTRIVRVVLRRENLRFPFGEDFVARLENRNTGALERRGKYLLLSLSGGDILLMHLGMSGRFRILPATPDQYERHDHVALMTEDGVIIFNDARRFGFMEIWPDDACRRLSGMGPEPLSHRFSGDFLHRSLSGRQTAIKVALLNQSICAGMGNIYAGEALFRAGIHPARPAGSLSASEGVKLSRAIKSVLRQAIVAGGTSLRDHIGPDGKLGYFGNYLSVYGRAGKACRVCGTLIEKLRQGGRSGFYCPLCQLDEYSHEANVGRSHV